MESKEEIALVKSEAVASLMEKRHILDDDVKQVIYHAETTGEKLYQQPEGNRHLAKMALENATFYVEYSVTDGSYEVHTVYSHGSKLVEE